DIDTLGSDLKTQGEVKFIGKDSLLVGLAVSVGIFQYKDLIVGFGVARTVVGIAGNGCYPKPALIIEGNMNRFGQIRKFHFRSEKLNPVSRGGLYLFQRSLAEQVFRCAVA